MKRFKIGSGSRGFTMVELLVVMVIVLILMAGIGQLFTRQVKSFSAQDETAKMQQQARMAEDLILKTIQQTGGYGETGGILRGGAILAASDRYVVVQYDDPLYTDHLGVIRANEIVAFAVSNPSCAGGSQTNVFEGYFDMNHDGTVDPVAERFDIPFTLKLCGPPYNLYRITPDEGNPTGGNPNMELLAENVENFVLSYYDNDARQLPFNPANNMPLPLPFTLGRTTDIPNVRYMSVELVLRSAKADKEYSANYAVLDNSVGTYDASGNPRTAVVQSDGYRRRSYKSQITPRNLPTSPCGQITLTASPTSPICPAGTTVTATAIDRFGNPLANLPVAFTLPGGTAYAIPPSLSGGAGTGARTDVTTNAAGVASATLSYQGRATSILVSAQVDTDCRPEGPDPFTLSDAISVNFVPGASARVTISQSTSSIGRPILTCEPPDTDSFALHSYDACGNEVAPQPGYRLGVYDRDVVGGTFMGQLNNSNAPVEFTSLGQVFTVKAPQGITPTAEGRRDSATGTIYQYVREAARPAWVIGVYQDNLPPPWGTGSVTYAANAPSVNTIHSRPWPPRTLTVTSDLISAAVLSDCPGSTDPEATFQIKACGGTSLYTLTTPPSVPAPTDGYTAKAVLSASGSNPPLLSDRVQIGDLVGRTGSASTVLPVSNDVQVEFSAHASPPNGNFYLKYVTPTCQFAEPDFPLGTLARPSLNLKLEGPGVSVNQPFTPQIAGCRTCAIVVNPSVVSTCEKIAKVTLTNCEIADIGQQVILTLSGGVNASWVEKSGNNWVTPLTGATEIRPTMVANPGGGAMAEAYISVGDTPPGVSITITASSTESNAPAPGPGGSTNPKWQCATPVPVDNECVDLRVKYATLDDQGVEISRTEIQNNTNICAASAHKLYVEMDHCLARDALEPGTVLIEIYKNGAVYDSVDVDLVADPPGVMPGKLYKNLVGISMAMIDSAQIPNTTDDILNYPDSGTLVLKVKVNIADTDGSCAEMTCPFTQPVPVCFPNAITSGGGASWNGNFKVHWGDVVVRGTMTAPAKLVEKSMAGQFNGARWGGNNYTDRFVDIYVGFMENGTGGTIDPYVNVGPAGTVNQPFKAGGNGNYFTNITTDKITSMIVQLPYETMKQIAVERGTYWYTLPSGKIFNNDKVAILPPAGLDLETVLDMPPNLYNNGDYIFVDTFSSAATPYVPPNFSSDEIQDEADADRLPYFRLSGGYYTTGIIYLAANLEFTGGGNPRAGIYFATTPPEYDTRYDHNTAVFTEDDLPIRPDPGKPQRQFNLTDLNLNGALYVVGKFGGAGGPSIFGAITGERGYDGTGTPEVWYNYQLNQSGVQNSLCVRCCNMVISDTSIDLLMNQTANVSVLQNSGTVLWSSSNPAVATVAQGASNTQAIITARSPGSTTILAADINNCTVSVTITVTSSCLGYTIKPSAYPSMAGTFTVASPALDIAISDAGNVPYAGGNWTWSTVPDATYPGAVNILPSTTSTNQATPVSCGIVTVKAVDSLLFCPGPYESVLTISAPLKINNPPPGPYYVGDTIALSTNAAVGALTWSASPVGSAIITATGPTTANVRFTSSGDPVTGVTISASDAAYPGCAPDQLSFTVNCVSLGVVANPAAGPYYVGDTVILTTSGGSGAQQVFTAAGGTAVISTLGVNSASVRFTSMGAPTTISITDPAFAACAATTVTFNVVCRGTSLVAVPGVGPYYNNNSVSLTVAGFSGQQQNFSVVAGSAAITTTGLDTANVLFTGNGPTTIRATDSASAGACWVESTFNVDCKKPTVVMDSPANGSTFGAVSGVTSFNWKATPNDQYNNGGVVAPLDQISNLVFNVTPNPGVAGWPRTEFTSEYCGFGGDNCALAASSILAWPDGNYLLSVVANNTATACSKQSDPVTVGITINNCDVDFTDTFTGADNTALSAVNWTLPQTGCFSGTCAAVPVSKIMSNQMYLDLKTQNANVQAAASAYQPTNTGTWSGVKGNRNFVTSLSVASMDLAALSAPPAATSAGIRIDDGAGNFISVSAPAGALAARAPTLTYTGGSVVTNTNLIQTLTGTVTYRVTYNSATKTFSIFGQSSTVAQYKIADVQINTIVPANTFKVGPILIYPGSNTNNNKNDVISARFDNFSMGCN